MVLQKPKNNPNPLANSDMFCQTNSPDDLGSIIGDQDLGSEGLRQFLGRSFDLL